MPVSRLNKRKIINTSDQELYGDILEQRKVTSIQHYDTAVFNYDTTKKYNFTIEERIWKDGDRLYKLANEYYGSVDYWWVIAQFNQKPTDAHYNVGDLVLIPSPLEEVLAFIGVY